MLLSEGVKGMKGGAGGKGQMKPKNVRWCLPRCKQRPSFKPSQGNVTPPPIFTRIRKEKPTTCLQ